MATYAVPELETPTPVAANEVLLVASGDLRHSANQVCWPAQEKIEAKLIEAFRAEGYTLRRAHPFDERLKHGFIYSQRMGMDIFEHIHPDAPIVVAEAVWQYSYHILSGLLGHRGPILTVANWSGEWPGLVGMLNLNGCLHKAGVKFCTLWSKDFDDAIFREGLREWLREHRVVTDSNHVRELDLDAINPAEQELGFSLARNLQSHGAIMGVFDEGCMGMYKAM